MARVPFFSPCEEPTLAKSFIPQVEMGQKLGMDFADYFDYVENPTWPIANAPESGHMQFPHAIKRKPIAWEKMWPGMLNARLFIGGRLPGAKKRKEAEARAAPITV